MTKNFKYGLLALLLVLGAIYFYNKFKVAPKIDFPKLKLSDLSGKSVALEDFKGKKLVVSFGASWCPNCIDELNTLKKIKDTELQDVEVLVISDEDPARISAWKEKKGYPFTFIKMDQPFGSVGVNSIPTTYIINTKLEVKEQKVGYIDWEDASTVEHLKKLME